MGPLQMRGLIMFLPQFVRVFYRLMRDSEGLCWPRRYRCWACSR
jgi:hypothetical protein